MAQTRDANPVTAPKPDRVAEATAKILAMFDDPTLLPQAVAKTTLKRLAGDLEAPSAKWSLSNQLLMLLAHTKDARGFDQWKQVARRVKKGAKAFYILAPRTVRRKEQDAVTGAEVTRTIVVGFIGVPVFRYEDTEGAELERPDYAPPVLPPLAEVGERFGVKVRYAPSAGRFYGSFCPATGEIVLVTHDVDTWFHELAHAAHQRVLQARGDALTGGQVPTQEIVAETVAAVLCELYGFSGYLNRAREYVLRYAQVRSKTSPTAAVVRCLADVQKVLALLLEGAGADASATPEEAIAS